MKHSRLAIALAAAIIAVGGVWFTVSEPEGSPTGERASIEALRGTGVLDGKVFVGELGPTGEPADVEDTLEFADGLFVSRECERRCDYPPRPYYARRNGGAIEFISETFCREKNSTIVWRGRVENGELEGNFTWTAERWYWTIEKTFWFKGRLVDDTPALAER